MCVCVSLHYLPSSHTHKRTSSCQSLHHKFVSLLSYVEVTIIAFYSSRYSSRCPSYKVRSPFLLLFTVLICSNRIDSYLYSSYSHFSSPPVLSLPLTSTTPFAYNLVRSETSGTFLDDQNAYQPLVTSFNIRHSSILN